MRPRPSLETARRYLERCVQDLRLARQSRLPGLKATAALAGVSHGVMGEALAELKRSGVVEARPRRGTVLVPQSSDSP
jgi:DNA-binding FadR family transcriptional regulator